MPKWKGIVAKSFSQADFEAYCEEQRWDVWRLSFMVLHNTGAPSLSDRPNGLELTHIRNLESYYRDTGGSCAGSLSIESYR